MDFLKVNKAETVVNEERDSVGYQPKASNIYPGTLKVMYMEPAARTGSIMVHTIIKSVIDGHEVEFRNAECIASNKTGTLKNTYKDKKTNKETLLLGYTTTLNQLRLLAGQDFEDLSAVPTRQVSIAQFGSSEPKVVTAFDVMGMPVEAAVIEVHTQKNDGTPTKRNEIDRVLNVEGKTYTEVKDGTEAEFKVKWLEKNQGQPRNVVNKNANQGVANAATLGQPTNTVANQLNI